MSVAIMGGLIVGLLLARARGERTHAMANEMLACTEICASQVAALRADIAREGQGTFAYPQGYEWSIVRTALPDNAPKRLRAYEVSVRPPAGGETSGVSAVVWLPAALEPAGKSR